MPLKRRLMSTQATAACMLWTPVVVLAVVDERIQPAGHFSLQNYALSPSALSGAFEAGMGSGQAGQDIGQTKEHAQLARSLGVDQLVVVVNKMDVVSFDRAVFEGIRASLMPFVVKQCGFREAAVRWLPISGLLGINLNRAPPKECPLSTW